MVFFDALHLRLRGHRTIDPCCHFSTEPSQVVAKRFRIFQILLLHAKVSYLAFRTIRI
ncbi:hypothetical protein D3C86_1410710 [compost metagenome]